MKNKFMRKLFGTFLGLLLFGCATVFVSGQENTRTNTKSLIEDFGPGIEGVWRTTVTQRNCATGVTIRTFKGLQTFDEGGTIAETSSALPPAFRSPGHGLWEKQGAKSYYGAFIFQFFNPDGSYAGTQKIKQNYQLSRFGDTFTSNGAVEIADPNDNLIATGCASATAVRFDPR